MEYKTILVPVVFNGTVEVQVPARLSEERQQSLGRRIGFSRVLATIDDPDAPDEAAVDSYIDEHGLDEVEAEGDWDDAKVIGVDGSWMLLPDEARQ